MRAVKTMISGVFLIFVIALPMTGWAALVGNPISANPVNGFTIDDGGLFDGTFLTHLMPAQALSTPRA